MITTEDRDLQTRSQDSILEEREGEFKKIQNKCSKKNTINNIK